MTKQELYRDICIEAGTMTSPEMTAEAWYEECGHNITPDLDATLERASAGDVASLVDVRIACGLPVLA
jgi:2-keto-3-deoxy-6-phosphogluconate aldolase